MPGTLTRYSRSVIRLLLAVSLLLPALARAESDAYGSLVGMAGAAETDKGPEAGDAPNDEPKEEAKAEPAVTVPAPQAPRIWTRLFASLLPPMPRASEFEVAASTAAPRARPVPSRPATPASAAGSAQGLLEVVSAATAPASPDTPAP